MSLNMSVPLQTFSQFSLRIVLRSCVNDSKPMDCGYESHRRLYVLIGDFAIVV